MWEGTRRLALVTASTNGLRLRTHPPTGPVLSSERPRLDKESLSDLGLKTSRRNDVDRNAQQSPELLDKVGMIEKGTARVEVHQQINVGSFVFLASRH